MGRGSTFHGEGGQNTMGREVDIPWVGGVKIPWVGGFDMPWGGGRYTMCSGVDISWVGESIYNG
jgi:hypothetical protein